MRHTVHAEIWDEHKWVSSNFDDICHTCKPLIWWHMFKYSSALSFITSMRKSSETPVSLRSTQRPVIFFPVVLGTAWILVHNLLLPMPSFVVFLMQVSQWRLLQTLVLTVFTMNNLFQLTLCQSIDVTLECNTDLQSEVRFS